MQIPNFMFNTALQVLRIADVVCLLLAKSHCELLSFTDHYDYGLLEREAV